MNRFEQRVQSRLKDEEFAAGYRDMAGEIDLLQAIDEAREHLCISKEELAARMGRRRESVSRLLNAEDANPTLDTVVELLSALGLTAVITLRKAEKDEAPLEVVTAL